MKQKTGKRLLALLLSLALMAGIIMQGGFVITNENASVVVAATDDYVINSSNYEIKFLTTAVYNLGEKVELIAGQDFYVMNSSTGKALATGYYKVAFSNNTNVGTATVTVTGQNGYSGSLSANFTIEPITLGNLSTSGTKALKVYLNGDTTKNAAITSSTANNVRVPLTGTTARPSVEVWVGSKKLTEGTDYSVTYANNTYLWDRTTNGTSYDSLYAPRVRIQGKGNFAGASNVADNKKYKDVYFSIVDASSVTDISNATVTVASCTYNGSAQKPAVTVKVGSTTLTQGTDYTATYSNNTNAGTGTVTIVGTGSYAGSVTKTFTISKKQISASTVTATAADAYYNNGNLPSTTITVKDTSRNVTLTTNDYSLSYSGSYSVGGTVKVTITGKGNYQGSRTVTYKVLAKTPTISTLENLSNGVKITWGAVAGAAKYRVFYKTSGSSGWTKIADTTATSYTWTGAKNGTAYTFTVRCISSDGASYTSNYDSAGKSITFGTLATPTITALDNVSGGIQIKWGAVSGAVKYRVFYRLNSGSSWTKLTDTTSTSYTWSGAKVGTTYIFTVRCISSDGTTYTSNYDSAGKSITATSGTLATPSISSLTNTNGSVKITWGAVTGAAKYRVFYRLNTNSSWTKLVDTASTSYTWTGAKPGTKYIFTVRCINSDGTSYTSNYDSTGKSITTSILSTPKISSVSNVNGGVEIVWGTVSGAAKYRVYYKTGSGSWTKIADTTATSYTWKGATSGTKYTFTVRCINSDATSFTSDYDATGKSITYLAAPTISSLSNTSSGVQIKWGAVTGAAKYRVFYRTSTNSSWTKLADTTSTSYTWSGAKSGTTYIFTVRCISSDGTSYTSGYNATGKTITYTK